MASVSLKIIELPYAVGKTDGAEDYLFGRCLRQSICTASTAKATSGGTCSGKDPVRWITVSSSMGSSRGFKKVVSVEGILVAGSQRPVAVRGSKMKPRHLQGC